MSDAEPHHIPGETLFNDHCHLNEKGNEILLQTFFDKMDVEKVREIRVVPKHWLSLKDDCRCLCQTGAELPQAVWPIGVLFL